MHARSPPSILLVVSFWTYSGRKGPSSFSHSAWSP